MEKEEEEDKQKQMKRKNERTDAVSQIYFQCNQHQKPPATDDQISNVQFFHHALIQRGDVDSICVSVGRKLVNRTPSSPCHCWREIENKIKLQRFRFILIGKIFFGSFPFVLGDPYYYSTCTLLKGKRVSLVSLRKKTRTQGSVRLRQSFIEGLENEGGQKMF